MRQCLFVVPILWSISLVSFAQAQELSLQQAVSEAYQNSPKIQKSQSVYSEAGWKRVEAYSGFLPTLTAQATYLNSHKYLLTDIVFGGSPTSVPAVIPTSNLVFSAQLPIFDGFASSNRLWANQSLESSAEKELDWVKFQTDREVTLQFYKALAAQILKDVAEQNLKTIEDHQKDVAAFRKAGISTKFDALRVDVQVSEARSEVLNAIDNVEISKGKLGELLGEEQEIRSLQGKLPVLKTDMIQNTEVDAFTNRQDIQALEDKTQAYRYQESASSRYFVPKISLFGQYQYYNNINNDISDTDRYREAYQVGINLTWNIFDGMASIARSKQSVEERYQNEKTLHMYRLKAKQDLDLWKRKYIYFCSIYQSRLGDVEKSEESVRLAKAGRRAGTRTNTELLDAEAELFRARAGAVNAQIGSVEALIQLELASGKKLYQFK